MELVIKKKDIIKMGKDLIKEVHEFLNDDYFKETFPEEMSKTSNTFNNYLVQRVFGNRDRTSPEKDLESLIAMIKEGILDIKVIFETL